MKTDDPEQLIEDLLDGDISEADFLRLEAEMIVSEEVRQAYYERQKLNTALQIDAESRSGTGLPATASAGRQSRRRWKIDWLTACGLAALVLVVGAIGWRIGQDSGNGHTHLEEPVATGFGVVAAESDAVWGNEAGLKKGDLLPAGKLTLESGIGQLELFSGVLLLVEGEAEFEVNSPMELSVTKGKIRIQVPELARGFRVRMASGEVVDLGTEFALEVTPAHADLHAVIGDVEWRPNSGTLRKLAPGESMRWDIGAGREVEGFVFDAETLVRLGSFKQALTARQVVRLEKWRSHSRQLGKDPRLLVYFPMDQQGDGNRELIDESGSGIDGAIVRAEPAIDRWGRPNGGLDFSRMGSRVRLNVPGEHQSLTLMGWVKIDSLDRLYNSLFLTDGHELHEPHWQIMNDGRLFFSVKARDEKGIPDKHIAYSPPIWTPAQSGQWTHLATAYDGKLFTTTHYVNGEAVSIDHLPEEFRPEKVVIGAASIGNWSEPRYRKDAEFAVRNLNGSMDEFALFSAALPAAEIREIYEVGRP